MTETCLPCCSGSWHILWFWASVCLLYHEYGAENGIQSMALCFGVPPFPPLSCSFFAWLHFSGAPFYLLLGLLCLLSLFFTQEGANLELLCSCACVYTQVGLSWFSVFLLAEKRIGFLSCQFDLCGMGVFGYPTPATAAVFWIGKRIGWHTLYGSHFWENPFQIPNVCISPLKVVTSAIDVHIDVSSIHHQDDTSLYMDVSS